jgi:hypothetical protein
MFSKIVITMILLAISAISYGAEEIPTSKLIHDYIKDKVELLYHGEFYALRADNSEFSNHKSLHLPMLNYKFAKNWKFAASAEFKYSDTKSAAFPNRFFRALYSVTRDNVLTEKEHGIKVDLGFGRRVFDRKSRPNDFGNNRLTANFSRSIPGGIGKNTASLFTQYLHNDPKTLSAETWKHGVELIPSITLVFNDKLSYTLNDDINYMTSYYSNNPRKDSITHEAYSTFTYKKTDAISPYFQLKWYHGDSFNIPDLTNPGAPYQNDTVSYYIGCGYAVTPKLTLTPEIGSDLFASSDAKAFFADKARYIDQLALYVDYTF